MAKGGWNYGSSLPNVALEGSSNGFASWLEPLPKCFAPDNAPKTISIENLKGCAKDRASPIDLGAGPNRMPVTFSALFEC